MSDHYRMCARCLMDSSVPDIRFNEAGICQFCLQFEERMANELYANTEGQARLSALMEKIKSRKRKGEYDCLIGLSGGVDSSYVAYLVKEKYKLRPLAVNLSNGWDSEIAIANIEQIIKRLEIDLHTCVLDWEEFKDLQISFLKSSISNIEIPTDHAIWALMIRTAAQRGIRYIFSGSNIATEALMPESWLYNSKDARLIESIQNRFGRVRLKSFPRLSTFDYVYYLLIKGVKWIPILNYIPYDKRDAKRILIEQLGWRDYGGKHYESIYTRFFHTYYLPHKFGYDLRRSYLSALVLSGQMTRSEAQEEIACPPASPVRIQDDLEFVIKKLNLTPEKFKQIMEKPPIKYSSYPNSDVLWKSLGYLVRAARRRIIHV